MKALVAVPVAMVTVTVTVMGIMVRGRSYSSGSPVRKMVVMAAVVAVVVVVAWLGGSCHLEERVGVAMAQREGSSFGGGWRLRMGRRKVRGGPAVVTD